MSLKHNTIDDPRSDFGSIFCPELARTEKLNGRVLVVDDSSDCRLVFRRALRALGLVVETAENGLKGCEQALTALYDGHPFDLILMDVNMPVMDGVTATMRLRQIGYFGPIAAMTAGEESRGECLSAGCDDFATKPISFENLFDVVKRNLGGLAGRRRLLGGEELSTHPEALARSGGTPAAVEVLRMQMTSSTGQNELPPR